MKKKIIIGGILTLLLITGAIIGNMARYRFTTVEQIAVAATAIPRPQVPLMPLDNGPADWPQWKGINHDDRSAQKNIQKNWKDGLKKIWEVRYLCQQLKSSTWGGPAIRGSRLIVPGRDEKNDFIFCLNAENGQLIWHQQYASLTKYDHGPGIRATPTIDGDRVYTIARNGDFRCWALYDGRLIWRRNLTADGGKQPHWGYSGAPFIYKNTVIMQTGGSRLITAYHKITGEIVWQKESGGASYVTPMLMKVSGQEQMMVLWGEALYSFNPANGQKYWNLPWKVMNNINITTPVAYENMLFVTSGYEKGAMGVTVSSSGAQVIWKHRKFSSHHSDPIIINGNVYGYSGWSNQNRGKFMCLKLATGEVLWQTNRIGWGTIILVDDHFICLDIQGNLFLVKPDPKKFTLVSEFRNAIPEVKTRAWTKPVAANGKLYLRYRHRLICFDITQ